MVNMSYYKEYEMTMQVRRALDTWTGADTPVWAEGEAAGSCPTPEGLPSVVVRL